MADLPAVEPALTPVKAKGKKAEAATPRGPRIRYALAAGNIAQVAVLPGFLNATQNSELTAFVADDPKKLKGLSKVYQLKDCYNYDDYEDCLQKVDAACMSRYPTACILSMRCARPPPAFMCYLKNLWGRMNEIARR